MITAATTEKEQKQHGYTNKDLQVYYNGFRVKSIKLNPLTESGFYIHKPDPDFDVPLDYNHVWVTEDRDTQRYKVEYEERFDTDGPGAVIVVEITYYPMTCYNLEVKYITEAEND